MTRIADLLAAGPTFSLEFGPPRTPEQEDRLSKTLVELEPLAPSFVSVTYGALGSTRDTTERIVDHIATNTSMTVMPHLTCVGHTRGQLEEIVGGYRDRGIENLLCLGGDLPEDGSDLATDFSYASELIHLAQEIGDFSVGVAAFPELHPRSTDRDSDRHHLAAKLREADFGITQFFFGADDYFRMVDELAALGVDTPVLPGIMSLRQRRGAATDVAPQRRPPSPPTSSGASTRSTATRRGCGSSPSRCARSSASACSTAAPPACTCTRSTSRGARSRSGRTSASPTPASPPALSHPLSKIEHMRERDQRRPTRTSNFGVGKREAHDASAFYARFEAPELSDDETVAPRFDVAEPCIHGDIRERDDIPDNSVALVVTSPPYFAGKQYEEELGQGGVPASYREYLELLETVFAACVQKLEPGGRIAVNVANLGRKPYRSLSADVITILQDRLKLLLRGEIVWKKGEGAGGQLRLGFVQAPGQPGAPRHHRTRRSWRARAGSTARFAARSGSRWGCRTRASSGPTTSWTGRSTCGTSRRRARRASVTRRRSPSSCRSG